MGLVQRLFRLHLAMLVFNDIFNGQELFSSSSPHELIDDAYYQVRGEMISVSGEIDDRLIGGNASAEGGEDEKACDTAERGIDIVLHNQLQEVPFTKSDFKSYMKGFCKRVKDRFIDDEERVKTFQTGAMALVKKVINNFDEYTFYVGKDFDQEAVMPMMYWDNNIPTFLFLKEALVAEKF